MVLSNREKMAIIVANAITLYSQKLQEGTLPKNQSVIDFILKNIPESTKSELSIELIDEVISFVSESHMELS